MYKDKFRNYIAVFFLISAAVLFVTQTSRAEEAWLTEFESVCGKTQEAGSLTKEELKALVEKSDKVKTLIENSSSPQKRMYLFRLDKCKKLYLYMLESSETK